MTAARAVAVVPILTQRLRNANAAELAAAMARVSAAAVHAVAVRAVARIITTTPQLATGARAIVPRPISPPAR